MRGWRQVWGEGDFPFYFVQIAPYNYGCNPEVIGEFWEAQAAAQAVPNTGMAVITDIGDLKDIHPKNKQEVGRRLALWALAKTYGQEKLVYSRTDLQGDDHRGRQAAPELRSRGRRAGQPRRASR